jgi:hypothetical protein
VIATHTPEPAADPSDPAEPDSASSPVSVASSSVAFGSSNASEPSSPSEAIDLILVPPSTSVSIEKYVPSFLNNFIFDDPL